MMNIHNRNKTELARCITFVMVEIPVKESKMAEITYLAYLVSMVEVANIVQQIGTAALLIVNIYILVLIWGNDSIYPFALHNKSENGNVSSFMFLCVDDSLFRYI